MKSIGVELGDLRERENKQVKKKWIFDLVTAWLLRKFDFYVIILI
jgi:hypothetical protein